MLNTSGTYPGTINLSSMIYVDTSYLIIRGAGPDPNVGGTKIVFRPNEDTKYDTIINERVRHSSSIHIFGGSRMHSGTKMGCSIAGISKIRMANGCLVLQQVDGKHLHASLGVILISRSSGSGQVVPSSEWAVAKSRPNTRVHTQKPLTIGKTYSRDRSITTGALTKGRLKVTGPYLSLHLADSVYAKGGWYPKQRRRLALRVRIFYMYVDWRAWIGSD